MTGLQQWTPLALFAAAAFSLWLYIHTTGMGSTGSGDARQPELFIQQPSWTVFDQQGQPVRRLHAQRLEQWSDQQGARLIEPQLVLSDSQQRQWHAQARRGWIYPDRQSMVLDQQVTIEREPGKNVLVLKTEHLRIADSGDLVETDAAVVLQAGRWHFTSNGLRTDLGRQRLELLKQVRGIHE